MKSDNSKTPPKPEFISDDIFTEIPKPSFYLKPDLSKFDREEFRKNVELYCRWRSFYDQRTTELE